MPLLALYLHTSPQNIVFRQITHGTYLVGGHRGACTREYELDAHEAKRHGGVPPGSAWSRATAHGTTTRSAVDLPASAEQSTDRAPSVEARPRDGAADRGSGQGAPTAPAGTRLRLLPFGPDLVRGPTSQGTLAHQRPGRRGVPRDTPLGREFGLAGADCEFRAPLTPRLARSAAECSGWRAGAMPRHRGRVSDQISTDPRWRLPAHTDRLPPAPDEPRRPVTTRAAIETRALGRSQVTAPRIALGCGNFGGIGSSPQFFGGGLDEAPPSRSWTPPGISASSTSTPPTPTAAGAARRSSATGSARAGGCRC